MTSPALPRLAVAAAAMSNDFHGAIEAARESGFAGVQLSPRLGGLDLPALSQSGQRELRAILRSSGMELAGLRLHLGEKGFGPQADIDAALDRIETILRAAAGLQCSLVCLDPGILAIDEKSIPIVDATMVELGRRADRHGVVIAFRSELSPFSALQRAIKSADCPWFGIDLDPVAVLIDDWSEDEVFTRVGGLIRHVRGRDAVLGGGGRTKPAVAGHGSVDWARLLADLEGAAYRGWITLDPADLPNPAAAAKAGIQGIKSAMPHKQG